MTQPLPPVTVAPDDLARVMDLYMRGLCLQAYHLAESLGPLRAWTGTAARLLGGRLAIHLGAPRLTYWMHLRAWRADRTHPEACYYHARAVQDRRGSLAGWRFLRKIGELPEDAPANVRSDWLAFHSSVLGRFRDFDAAEAYLARAEQVCPDQPWTCLERAFLLELEDRYEESLAASRRALKLRPWYRPGVQAAAHTLELLDRNQEALDLLTEASERIESGLIVAQLATLQTELGRHNDARKSFARFADLSPLMEKTLGEWLAARRSDTAYYAGDYAEAAEQARQAKNPFHDKIAEHLSRTPFEGRRVQLEVGFVRQHHQTCAPAVLASLSRFWKMPADHLQVAAAICYDGTPDHRERAWAESNGWHVREFAVSWDSARALIDRGVPFTLTTMDPGNAHLQAVIGYDTCRNTLIIRDPTQRHTGEFLADTMLAHYRSVGPRGMAMVPAERADLLDGLDLPDAPLYDQVYRLQLALQEHDRARAAAVHREMEEAAPGHRLTLQAQRILALYDADTAELLASVEELLKLFPDDSLLLLGKLACLRELARRDERLELLQKVSARPDSDPIFWRQYAQELAADAREHPTAVRLLQRVIRFRPFDEGALAALANILWDQRRFAEALELYNFAACLDDKDEGLARSWFSAARHLKQTDRTLRFLVNRFQRFGARSSQPARTLYWAYCQYERTQEALDVLDAALKLRPDDGDLLLFAAQARSNHGDFEGAADLLARAEGHCQRSGWLRTAAGLAEARGDLAGALSLWRQVAEAEPLALDANRAVAQLLAETDGRPAALAHLEQACRRFPHNFLLHQLWIGWLRDEGPAATEPVIRHILAIHPADAWARRELALCLSDQGRLVEANAELETAYHLEPTHVSYCCVKGQLCERAGRRAEAREAYRQAIRLSVDTDYAIGRLMEMSDTQAERREALAFIEAEMVRQVMFGDGILAYQQFARHTLDPEELLASLRKALDARPDLWHAWSAVIRQLVETERAQEAAELAARATGRFPLLPQLWFDRAVACRLCENHDGEVEALQHALQIRPGWSVAQRRLAEVYERDGRLDESLALLQQAVARAPLDAVNHGCLADALWQKGEREAALERLKVALRLDPGYDWAWNTLRDWCRRLERPNEAIELARDMTQRRPDEARSWLMLARTLSEPDHLQEQLAALERALELNPRCVEAYDLKAALLTKDSRHDEAQEACRAPVWDGQTPLILRGRSAWVEAERGNVVEALTIMKAALAEDPNYYWGWENLADWARDEGEDDDYLEAAENMVRLAPQNPVSYGYRGDARQRKQDRAGAKEDFRHAFEMAPTYSFSGMALFDVQLAGGELDEAGRTLAVLKEHDANEFVLAREVQLAARRADRAEALKGLRRLAETTSDATWPLESAAHALVEAGWANDVEQGLGEALDAPDVHPRAGPLWVERRAARKAWDCDDKLAALLTRGDIGRETLIRYAKALAHAKEKDRLRACIRRHGQALRDDDRGWGEVGFCFASLEDYFSAADWMTDWAGREEAQPWMLINLAISLRGIGDDVLANRVSRRALELPGDYTVPYHTTWLALDDALAGDTAAAVERAEDLDAEDFDNTHRYAHALLQAVLTVQQAEPAGRRAAWKQARRQLAEAARTIVPLKDDRPALVRAYRRCVRRVGQDARGVAPLWARWRSLWPLLPAATVPAPNGSA